MKKFLIVSLIAVLACLLTAGYIFGYNTGPKIDGPPEFKDDIQEAMTLLKEKAPKYYKLVNNNLKEVYYNITNNYNGLYVGIDDYSFWFNKKEYENCKQNAELKKYWIATTLVHEATHAYRYRNELDSKVKQEEKERIAVEAEKDVAKLLNAPPEVMEFLDIKMSLKWWEKQGK